jgi:hypothetical protein
MPHMPTYRLTHGATVLDEVKPIVLPRMPLGDVARLAIAPVATDAPEWIPTAEQFRIGDGPRLAPVAIVGGCTCIRSGCPRH